MKKAMNNKGFSLVELIIVVAIMAILVGVLAPVYTQYVEKSRKSSDVSAFADAATAVETVFIDYAARGKDLTSASVTIDKSGVIVNVSGNTTAQSEIAAIIGTYKLQAKSYNSGTISASSSTNSATPGAITWTSSGDVVTMESEYESIKTKLHH